MWPVMTMNCTTIPCLSYNTPKTKRSDQLLPQVEICGMCMQCPPALSATHCTCLYYQLTCGVLLIAQVKTQNSKDLVTTHTVI